MFGPSPTAMQDKINVLQTATIKTEFKTINIKTANRISCSTVPGSRYTVDSIFQYIKNIIQAKQKKKKNYKTQRLIVDFILLW